MDLDLLILLGTTIMMELILYLENYQTLPNAHRHFHFLMGVFRGVRDAVLGHF